MTLKNDFTLVAGLFRLQGLKLTNVLSDLPRNLLPFGL